MFPLCCSVDEASFHPETMLSGRGLTLENYCEIREQKGGF